MGISGKTQEMKRADYAHLIDNNSRAYMRRRLSVIRCDIRRKGLLIRKCWICGEYSRCGKKTQRRARCLFCEVIARRLGSMAANAVWCAIRKGKLEPAKNHKCADCGDPATEYDHRDYEKPLVVVPVCRTCNARRGPAKPLLKLKAAPDSLADMAGAPSVGR